MLQGRSRSVGNVGIEAGRVLRRSAAPCVIGLMACMSWAGVASGAAPAAGAASSFPPGTVYAVGGVEESVSVSAFAIGPGGALKELGGGGIDFFGGADRVAVSPDQRFAYVTNGLTDQVSAYTIDPLTGALSDDYSQADTGSLPGDVKVTPNGKYAYVANRFSSSLSMFAVNGTTGALTALAIPSISVSAGAGELAITPDGKYAYVTGGGSVSMFSINAKTGQLRALSTPRVAAASPHPRSPSRRTGSRPT